MEICIGYRMRSKEIFYMIYDDSEYYGTDFTISEYLGLDIKEYRKRLKKIGPHTTDYMGEIYFKRSMMDEKFIDAFKNEFVEELTLAKLKNK